MDYDYIKSCKKFFNYAIRDKKINTINFLLENYREIIKREWFGKCLLYACIDNQNQIDCVDFILNNYHEYIDINEKIYKKDNYGDNIIAIIYLSYCENGDSMMKKLIYEFSEMKMEIIKEIFEFTCMDCNQDLFVFLLNIYPNLEINQTHFRHAIQNSTSENIPFITNIMELLSEPIILDKFVLYDIYDIDVIMFILDYGFEFSDDNAINQFFASACLECNVYVLDLILCNYLNIDVNYNNSLALKNASNNKNGDVLEFVINYFNVEIL